MTQEELVQVAMGQLKGEISELRNLISALRKYQLDQIVAQIPAIHERVNRVESNAERLIHLTSKTEPISPGALIIAFVCVIVSTMAGFILTIELRDSSFIARSGAVTCIIGVLLLGWQLLQSKHQRQKAQKKILASGGFGNEGGPLQAFFDWQDAATLGALVGLGLVVFGTMVWGFGDLFRCCQPAT